MDPRVVPGQSSVVPRARRPPPTAPGEPEFASDRPSDERPPTADARAPSGFLARLPPLHESAPCLHVGIDENGLGPVLGPMIVTGVAFVVRGPRPASLGALVGDSKALVSHADVSLGEAWTRALLAALGETPRTPAELVERLSMDDAATLRAPCPRPEGVEPTEHPAHPASMCWPASEQGFVADDALVARCARIIRGWTTTTREGGRFPRRVPVALAGVRTSIVCASRLNASKSSGRHKFVVDLHEMERIALAFHDAHGRAADGTALPLDAVCGKVGGMGYYGDYFGPLSGRLRAIEAEQGMASAYRFPGLGRVTFLQDADAADPLVGLASLVGKYVRELMMGRIVHYMRASMTPENCPEQALPSASGYRDPATKRFIAATELIRAHRGVPDRCFLRRA
ncbi:MAG: hypothetical protein NVSMB47_00490 [Polyangiales bacterium]